MKILAWYTIIFSVLTILAFVLSLVKIIPTPTFTSFEQITWALATIPVFLLGFLVLKQME